MTDRPILFSAPMITALLDGRKTMTRRIAWRLVGAAYPGDEDLIRKPTVWQKTRPGDRLWCRETWAHYHTVNHVRRQDGGAFAEVSDGLAGYRADGFDGIEDFRSHVRLMSGADLEAVEINGDRWRPSIFMPRWASRLTLTVTDVKIERVQDISEEDARAEGMNEPYLGDGDPPFEEVATTISRRRQFRNLWDSLNAKRGFGWDANPWVAAISFSVHQRNIDTMEIAA